MDLARPIQAVIPGAQGRILAVLSGTSAELNLRTIARLSGVSIAQASRVLPHLVTLGMVDRREAPPSALFCLRRDHVASRALLALADTRQTVLQELGQAAGAMTPPPASLIIFGSFARGGARSNSDIDVVVVRPTHVTEDDEPWGSSMEDWRQRAMQLTGNRVEVIEVDENEIARLLKSGKSLWTDIARDGLVIFGRPLTELRLAHSA